MTKTPRGVRNHNPGNLRRGQAWQGLAAVQADPAFCVFREPLWGLRALARVLMTYHERHGLRTLAAILTRFAPASENNTAAYIAAAARACGKGKDDPLTFPDDLAALMRAIITHENGCQPYSDALIAEAIEKAK